VLKDVTVEGRTSPRGVGGNTQVALRDWESASGIDGFRSSHRAALTAHQMMVRLQSRQQIAFFEDIHMSRCSPKT